MGCCCLFLDCLFFFSAPTPTPTKAKILLHNDHPEEPTKSSGSQPNRDQLYHIKGNRKYIVILLSSYLVNDVFMQKLTSSHEVARKIFKCAADEIMHLKAFPNHKIKSLFLL